MKRIELKNIIKESITDYLSELNSTSHLEEELIDETPITEEVSELESNISKDGKIYLVRKPNKDTAEGGIVEEKSISELIGADYIGAFTSKEKAAAFGKKALKQRDSELKENVKKGQAKVGDLETQIATLKADMQKLIDNPDTRSELGSYTARLEKFEALLDKLKKSLEANSPKKEKKEDKDEEGLNEVASNTSKAFKWFWGTDAKEIAKRVQALSDKELKNLKDATQGATGGPQKIQKSFLDREIKKRGLNEK
jgi:HPt (histidine-containing phosphotransfer) domain-containing protein